MLHAIAWEIRKIRNPAANMQCSHFRHRSPTASIAEFVARNNDDTITGLRIQRDNPCCSRIQTNH